MASEPEPPFDEDHGDPDLYGSAMSTLAAADLEELVAGVARHLAEAGVSFGGEPFVVDPIPRLIAAAEWAELERGLAQRARALNAFLHDVYGERRIVTEGVMAAAVIDEAEGYEPDLAGRLPADVAPAAIIGFDLVRDPGGRFLVLEDNLRTPSGLAYALAARAAVQATLPPGMPRPRPFDPALTDLLAAMLRAAAPDRGPHDPQVVVVTDGPDNVAYYEHQLLAERIGAPLVTPERLSRGADDTLVVDTPGGSRRRVDVVYRRTDEDRIRDEHGALTPIAERVVGPWLAGRLGLINAFGNGVADDKLVHSHVEDFVRFYLGEEPLIASVPTLRLETPGAVDDVIAHLPELVVKPRHGHGGIGVIIGSHADAGELAEVAEALRSEPDQYIAQPIVPLSRHPTVIDGRLAHRHVDLRPFAFVSDDVRLAPGGLSRVAFDAGEMVVNSSQNGGGKDTWVVD